MEYRFNITVKITRKNKLNKFTFPVVRKVFPSLIAQQIVSVQPMSLPSGLLFYEEFQYKNKNNKKTKFRKNINGYDGQRNSKRYR